VRTTLSLLPLASSNNTKFRLSVTAAAATAAAAAAATTQSHLQQQQLTT
jgi:hypothetical protein